MDDFPIRRGYCDWCGFQDLCLEWWHYRKAEELLRVYFGWTKSSHIPARYVHLSRRDVDGALARHYGLVSGDAGIPCPRCGFINHGAGLAPAAPPSSPRLRPPGLRSSR